MMKLINGVMMVLCVIMAGSHGDKLAFKNGGIVDFILLIIGLAGFAYYSSMFFGDEDSNEDDDNEDCLWNETGIA